MTLVVVGLAVSSWESAELEDVAQCGAGRLKVGSTQYTELSFEQSSLDRLKPAGPHGRCSEQPGFRPVRERYVTDSRSDESGAAARHHGDDQIRTMIEGLARNDAHRPSLRLSQVRIEKWGQKEISPPHRKLYALS